MAGMRRVFSLLPLLCFSCLAWPQNSAPEVVRVQIDSPTKYRVGASVRAHTVEPLYEQNRLVLAAGTPIAGEIVQVTPASHKRRVSARIGGDFTPLHEVQIRFDQVVSRSGLPVSIRTATADEASAVVLFHSRGAKQQSLFHRLWHVAAAKKDQAIGSLTAPGKSYRLKQVLFSQLPWHPESLQPGAQYDITVLHPVGPAVDEVPTSESKKLDSSALLHARLLTDLNSAKAKPGDPVVAIVTQPKLGADNRVQIPQGTLLRGHVLQAKAAGKWGHNGALRFSFQKMEFRTGPAPTEPAAEAVTGVPSAVTGLAGADIQLDNEGGAKPQSNRTLLAPLSLGLLAGSALMEDEARVGHAAASSNGFGLLGRIIAISTGSNILGGTLGAVSTGRSVYSHFLAHGKDVKFPRNTEIEVDIGPSGNPMKVSSHR